jgi:hypothetical protein
MKREFKYSLTASELVEAISTFLDNRGEVNTPADAATPEDIKIYTEMDGDSDRSTRRYIDRGSPLIIEWSTLKGDEP